MSSIKNSAKQLSAVTACFIILFDILLPISVANSSSNSPDCYYQPRIIKHQLIHTVTINPIKHKIINATAKSIDKNVAHVGQIARKYNALAAINGGFFREIGNNLFVPAGILKVDNIWHGIAYKSRAAIGWQTNSSLVLIDRLTTKTSLKIGELQFPIYNFNPNYNVNKNNYNKLTLYSNIYPNFNNLNTLDEQNFTIIEDNQSMYIYNFNSKSQTTKFSLSELESAQLSVNIIPQLEASSADLWAEVDFITSGTPLLIKNHQVLSDYSKEKIASHFINTPHPRSAICILDNGFWKLIKTPSMTIPEIANVMEILQCKDAINLDGGSSSDLYLSEKLSNEHEFSSIVSPITDAILVLPT